MPEPPPDQLRTPLASDFNRLVDDFLDTRQDVLAAERQWARANQLLAGLDSWLRSGGELRVLASIEGPMRRLPVWQMKDGAPSIVRILQGNETFVGRHIEWPEGQRLIRLYATIFPDDATEWIELQDSRDGYPSFEHVDE